MSNRSSQYNTYPENGRLPTELIIFTMEISIARADVDYRAIIDLASKPILHWSIVKTLLNFRLVCKDWCDIVTPMLLHSIRLDQPRKVECILEHWRNSIIGPDSSPVERLSFEELSYQHPGRSAPRSTRPTRAERRFEIQFPSISMDQVMKVIELLGQNLTELQFHFRSGMGFSPEVVESIKQIKGLRKLTIDAYRPENYGWNFNSESIADLLNAIPNLETLTLHVCNLAVHFLDMQPQSGSKLKYFSCVGNSAKLLSHISKHNKDNLKVINYNSDSNLYERDRELALEPLKGTLEGFFTHMFPDNLSPAILDWNFPRLRVIYSHHWQRPEDKSIVHRLRLPILQNVRTVVTHYNNARDYWMRALLQTGPDRLTIPPNLKHIIFTSGYQHRVTFDQLLAEGFGAHEIQCHFMSDLTFDEILELDIKLNGPMD